MAPKYTLEYFNVRARGETTRLLFAAAGIKYEDKRYEFSEWPAIKSTMPQETLPVLTIDGKVKVSQSVAIARYVARECKLYGKNSMDMLLIDQIVDTGTDFCDNAIKAYFEKDETVKEEKMKEFFEKTTPRFLGMLEKCVTDSGKDGYAVSNNLSLADLALFNIIDFTRCIGVLDNYPKLKANRQKVLTNKKIAEYVKSRPDSTL